MNNPIWKYQNYFRITAKQLLKNGAGEIKHSIVRPTVEECFAELENRAEMFAKMHFLCIKEACPDFIIYNEFTQKNYRQFETETPDKKHYEVVEDGIFPHGKKEIL
jgi:hypothetical protein